MCLVVELQKNGNWYVWEGVDYDGEFTYPKLFKTVASAANASIWLKSQSRWRAATKKEIARGRYA